MQNDPIKLGDTVWATGHRDQVTVKSLFALEDGVILATVYSRAKGYAVVNYQTLSRKRRRTIQKNLQVLWGPGGEVTCQLVDANNEVGPLAALTGFQLTIEE